MPEAGFIQNVSELYASRDIWAWLLVLIASIIVTAIIKLSLKAISKKLRKLAEATESVWDDVGVDLIDGLRPIVLFAIVFYTFSKPLEANQGVQKALITGVVGLIIFQIWIAGYHVIRSWRNTVLNQKIKEDPSSAAALGLLYSFIQAIFVTTIVLLGLSNIGVDIGALLAGLGVGGIAVALAAQNILGDLLASLSIVLDKPFVIGDFIVTGDEQGRIEHIGIKTTRIRSITGEEIVLSNKDLLESRLQNFKSLAQRRVEQEIGVTYSTPPDKLKAIPSWVKEAIESVPQLRFDRCHFCELGESSLDFEIVFYVLDPDYNLYMDLQEKVLLKIYQKFAQENVGFAFPSRSIYVESLPEAKGKSAVQV